MGHMLLWALCLLAAAVIILAAVAVIRAVRLTPKHDAIFSLYDDSAPAPDDEAVERFRQVLMKRTVWRRDGKIEREEFDSFLPLLQKLYPDVFAQTQLDTVAQYGIILRWKGADVSLPPAVLMAHHDVVDANDDEWTYPPFEAQIHDGAVWARGAVDTKCILTGVLEAMSRLMAEGFVPQRDVYLISSNNEEIGGGTTPAQVEWFRERNIRPYFVLDEGGAVVSDLPMGVEAEFAMIGVSEKGSLDVILTAKGEAGHSSAPDENDPPYRLLSAMQSIRSHPFRSRLSPAIREMFRRTARYQSFWARLLFANSDIFSPAIRYFMSLHGETDAMIRTTEALTQLSGSDTINVIPSEAKAGYSVRVAPWDNTDTVERRIRELAAQDDVDVTVTYRHEPSPCSDYESETYALIAGALRKAYPNADNAPYIMTGGTDSKHFTSIGSDVYRFAGFRFTAEERRSMHGADEHLSVASYLKGIEYYVELIRSL